MKESRLTYLLLALIMLAYVAAGVQYARLTPPWQAPDEPAHFNYVRYVAEQGALPVLQVGDFPHQYLARFTNPKNTPTMSIDPLRYEAWQPPLYYLLAAVVYRAAGGATTAGQLLALRLFSVALGALLIAVAYRAVAALAPGRTWLALASAAFLAAVPMHVATTAAVNNDTLAELWVALVLWQLFALLRAPEPGLRRWAWLGLTLGLAGLTKLSTAITLPLALATLAYAAWRHEAAGRGRYLATRLAAIVVPAALLLLPWLARNAAVYGINDPLVFRWHEKVVEGQKLTADWLAEVGWRGGAASFASTAFHSFWGQFGWMGVPIDGRLYRGLGVLSGLALLGLLLRLPAERRAWGKRPPAERFALALLAALVALSLASFAWYNLTFLQPQGRYLFPALVPIGVFLAAGWREIARRARRPLAAGLLVAVALFLAARSALQHGPWDKWTLAGLAGGGGGFGLAAGLPERWAAWLYPLPYLLLLALDFYCLYACILPALA